MSITLNELARLAGVSNATASNALSEDRHHRVSKATRERILALARKHGYRRNLAGRALVKGKTYRVSVCIYGYLASSHSAMEETDLYEQFILYSRGIQRAGYGLDLVEVDADRAPEEVSRELPRRFSDGFLFLFWPPELVAKVLFSLKEKRVPAVASGTVLNDRGFTWTGVDEYRVFERATKRLLSEGHEQIAFIDVQSGSFPALKRRAFLDTIRRELGRDASEWVFPLRKPRVAELVHTTYAALDRMKGVRAFLASENRYCHAVIHALQSRGLQPGVDCRVIGYGEGSEANRSSPKLSHYSVMNKEQVEFGLEALLEQIKDPARYTPRYKLFEPDFTQLET